MGFKDQYQRPTFWSTIGRISQVHVSGGILPPLITEFVRDADSDRPVPFLRNGDARPNMIAHPLPALTLGYRSEDIKTAFEPVVKSVGNFDGLMLGVIRWIHAINDFLGAVNGEVAVSSTIVCPHGRTDHVYQDHRQHRKREKDLMRQMFPENAAQ